MKSTLINLAVLLLALMHCSLSQATYSNSTSNSEGSVVRKYTKPTTSTAVAGTLVCDTRTCCSYYCPGPPALGDSVMCAGSTGGFPTCFLTTAAGITSTSVATTCARSGVNCAACPTTSYLCSGGAACNTIPANSKTCSFRI